MDLGGGDGDAIEFDVSSHYGSERRKEREGEEGGAAVVELDNEFVAVVSLSCSHFCFLTPACSEAMSS